MALISPVKEVRIGTLGQSGGRTFFRSSFSWRKDLGFERDEVAGFVEWQLPENNSADQTEYRGGGADAKRQAKSNDQTEAEVGLS